MVRQVRCGSVCCLVVCALLSLVLASVARSEDDTPKDALKKATADGKYTKLLAIIHMPDDKKTYGAYKEYGAYSGTEWGDYKGLPKGNWVYVYPHWYIWGQKGKGGDSLPIQKATVKAKYSKLLAVIHMPDDKKKFGAFNDYGAYDGTEWGDYKGLPKGYWVYAAPHWYIWEKKDK